MTAEFKVQTDSLTVDTEGFCDVHNLTDAGAAKVRASGIQNGSVLFFVVGSTAALTTVEYEPGLIKDLKNFYEKIIPEKDYYFHEETWHDGNGFSHVRASLLKPSLQVPIVQGKMTLGTWQQIILIDFDNGPRQREIVVQTMGI